MLTMTSYYEQILYSQLFRRTQMNWGEVIFMLLALADVFVLVVIVFVLKSEKQSTDKKIPPKRGQ